MWVVVNVILIRSNFRIGLKLFSEYVLIRNETYKGHIFGLFKEQCCIRE